MKPLTSKQKEILEYISKTTAEKSYPPSVREICAAVGLKSPSTVHAHIKALTASGYLNKDSNKKRALSLPGDSFSRVPIVGRVTAGLPILAIEEIEGYMPIDLGGESGDHFALHVSGDSMINAGILDGDIIIVRIQNTADNGEIVVALLEDEATVKRLKKTAGKVWLMPENPAYFPIDGTEASILGKVTAVYRKY